MIVFPPPNPLFFSSPFFCILHAGKHFAFVMHLALDAFFTKEQRTKKRMKRESKAV